MLGAMAPLLGDDRQAILSMTSPLPLLAMPPTYPRSSRPAGTRAHKRWRVRRAAGRG